MSTRGRRKTRATPGTGSIYKHDSREGYVGQIQIDGRRLKVYGKTEAEARRKLNARIGGGPQQKTPTSSRLSVGKLLEDWMRRDVAGRQLTPSTLTRHRWAVDHLTVQIGHIPVEKLSVRDVERALDELAAAGLSRSSLVKVLGTLSQALTFGQRRDDVSRNVAKLSKVPPDAKAPVSRRALKPEQARSLLKLVESERNGAMFAMALKLGLRPGEAAGLYWSDLDLEAGTVNITRGVRLTKGRAEVVDDLKTDGAKRTLGLRDDLVAQLKAHKRAQTAERLAAPRWIDDRLVFASPTGNVLSPPNVRRHLTAICGRIEATRAESDPDSEPFPTIRPNELRHSCASYLSDQGVSNESIADVLGHTTTRMVDQTYRHRLRPVVDITRTVDWSAGAK
jgi:integrase